MTVSQRIAAFHAGRDPQLLARKQDLLRQDAFAFLRGTCFLFYQDLDTAALPESPLVWATGDLHLQNFGTFKGDNRLVYFDLNDFDECALAPAAWDLVRFCASLFAAAAPLGLARTEARDLAAQFLQAYAAALAHGKALWLERATATGPIRSLLSSLKKRKRRNFLAERVKGGRILTGDRALPLSRRRTAALRSFFRAWEGKHHLRPHFYRLLDAARRVAGNGSLGLERYVLLVEGRGGADGNFLLDLKLQPPSALLRAPGVPAQPAFPSDAQRVATVQQWCQAVSPALLEPVRFEGRSFLLHELLPTADRLSFPHLAHNPADLSDAIRRMGEVTAWSHLRSGARAGSAAPAELASFGGRRGWQAPLLSRAAAAARHNDACWREFAHGR